MGRVDWEPTSSDRQIVNEKIQLHNPSYRRRHHPTLAPISSIMGRSCSWRFAAIAYQAIKAEADAKAMNCARLPNSHTQPVAGHRSVSQSPSWAASCDSTKSSLHHRELARATLLSPVLTEATAKANVLAGAELCCVARRSPCYASRPVTNAR